jgi:hypothetical protein
MWSIYKHLFIYIYTHTYINMYINISIYVYTYIFTHTYINVCVPSDGSSNPRVAVYGKTSSAGNVATVVVSGLRV